MVVVIAVVVVMAVEARMADTARDTDAVIPVVWVHAVTVMAVVMAAAMTWQWTEPSRCTLTMASARWPITAMDERLIDVDIFATKLIYNPPRLSASVQPTATSEETTPPEFNDLSHE
jgi:hypothetical protein